MKIYVAAHKKINWMPKDPVYTPLQVGAALHDRLPYIGDDQGDSISEKNPNYCELTAYWWIWKNADDDITGLSHYRRYFVTYPGYIWKLLTGKNNGIITEKRILKDLKKHDVIVSNKTKCNWKGKDIRSSYAASHRDQDMQLFLDKLHELHPEYDEAAEKVMRENIYYTGNMIICRKELFDEYAEWLFSIFSAMEPCVDLSDCDAYQKRMYGFLSERVMRIWLLKNGLTTKERHIINTEDESIWKMLVHIIKTGQPR